MSSNNSNESSPSNSISLIKLDELSSFGATKQSRLPALIKLNTIDQNKQQQVAAPNSMPNFSESQLEKQGQALVLLEKQQHSLPVELSKQKVVVDDKMSNQQVEVQQQQADKENISMSQQQRQPVSVVPSAAAAAAATVADDESDDFQVVDMQQDDSNAADVLIGPSLPQVAHNNKDQQQYSSKDQIDKSINALQSSLQLGQSTHLGDSLIEMIINLRNENQNLVRALETNNEYVKERLSEFKRIQEDSKKREAQFALEKADFEHQIRKVQRQNSVLSERLKSMEAKLKDMKLEVSESLQAAHSSKASSLVENNTDANNLLYPLIDNSDSFGNEALARSAAAAASSGEEDPHQATTMQVDATSGELYNQNDQQSNLSNMETDQSQARPSATDFATMSKEELGKHFDAKKVEFYALDDPMKQCDKLEQQLNNIGKRDYEICLLQQQLNIYRQDFRLERMEKLEAKIQIEKLKNDIDRLCLERLQQSASSEDEQQKQQQQQQYQSSGRRISDGLGKFGHHLTKKAAKQAAKAAKYAAKQAHLEEKAAAALARVAAARGSATHQQHQPTTTTTTNSNIPSSTGPQQTIPKYGIIGDQQQSNMNSNQPAPPHHHHHGRHHSHHHHRHHSTGGGGSGTRPARGSGIRSEVVNDLLSTANKAMLTGYKMASTHVNLALDKLSQYEQQQANLLDKNKQQATATTTTTTGVVANNGKQQSAGSAPSAPLEYPSID